MTDPSSARVATNDVDEQIILAELADSRRPYVATRRRRVLLPVILFVATCYSTWITGGWQFSLALMAILTAHELGHFFQCLRYRVPASLPFFIPMPFSPIGTMGAVIGMQASLANRRSLFDIAITGPLAGLVPAIVFSVIGLSLSKVGPISDDSLMLGEPLIFKLLAYWIVGPLPEGTDIQLHPLGFAGWVGIFITALNLFPISQLDGGHVLYALLREKSHVVAMAVFAFLLMGTVVWGYTGWTLMIFLLLMMGIRHPPTSYDEMPLGPKRTTIGWLSLPFVIVGFTPTPFVF